MVLLALILKMLLFIFTSAPKKLSIILRTQIRWNKNGGYSLNPHFKVFGDTFIAVKLQLISKKIYPSIVIKEYLPYIQQIILIYD